MWGIEATPLPIPLDSLAFASHHLRETTTLVTPVPSGEKEDSVGTHELTPSSTLGAQMACQLGAERGNERAKKSDQEASNLVWERDEMRWGWRGFDPEGTRIGGSRELMGSARRARLWP